MQVPFLDLARHVELLRPRIDEAYARVLARGRFVLGEEVERFEAAFARYCGTRHAVGVASGTDAITVALAAAGILPGDEVVTAANTCVPTIVGIEQAGARPVLADVDPETLTLDPSDVERVLTARTRAIVPVHLYGQTADMAALTHLATAHGLELIEDCAQAHGAEYGGRRAGSLGRAAAFSFYPTKNLGALGDGGAVVTDDDEVAARARLLRNYGERNRFEHVLRGRNSRLDELQAAILGAKLPFLDEWNERRREIASSYGAALAGSSVRRPFEAAGRRHVYHLYVVRAPDRHAFRRALDERGIGTAVHYPVPVHRQPAYTELGRNEGFRDVDQASGEIVSLPLHADLSDAEVRHIAEVLEEATRP
jgi:dTDP-4-amino-4,6-dideoxygalactose transaminase